MAPELGATAIEPQSLRSSVLVLVALAVSVAASASANVSSCFFIVVSVLIYVSAAKVAYSIYIETAYLFVKEENRSFCNQIFHHFIMLFSFIVSKTRSPRICAPRASAHVRLHSTALLQG